MEGLIFGILQYFFAVITVLKNGVAPFALTHFSFVMYITFYHWSVHVIGLTFSLQ